MRHAKAAVMFTFELSYLEGWYNQTRAQYSRSKTVSTNVSGTHLNRCTYKIWTHVAALYVHF